MNEEDIKRQIQEVDKLLASATSWQEFADREVLEKQEAARRATWERSRLQALRSALLAMLDTREAVEF